MTNVISKNNHPKFGFTILELAAVITVIGILASISVVYYSNWKQNIVIAQIKSDLNGVAASMEDARNFGNVYPTSVPSTFTASKDVTLTGGSVDGGKTYCVGAQSGSLNYYIASSNNLGPQSGTCP